MDQLKEALLTLDPEDDAHWTEDGLPVVQVVGDLLGMDDLTREDVTDIAPQFGRETLRQIRADAVTVEEEEMPTETHPEAAVEAQLRDVDNELNELYEDQNRIGAKITDAQKRRSRLASKRATQRNEGSTQQAIRASINNSNKQRALRAKAHTSLMKKMTAAQLDPRSPYEQSRAAGKRPTQA